MANYNVTVNGTDLKDFVIVYGSGETEKNYNIENAKLPVTVSAILRIDVKDSSFSCSISWTAA